MIDKHGEFMQHDLEVARELGALHADMRTVKHEITNVSSKMDALSIQIGQINVRQEKGVSFFAGICSVFVAAGSAFVFLIKLIWDGKVL